MEPGTRRFLEWKYMAFSCPFWYVEDTKVLVSAPKLKPVLLSHVHLPGTSGGTGHTRKLLLAGHHAPTVAGDRTRVHIEDTR